MTIEGSSPEHSESATRARERLVLLILASVQFITIVDFMIVMPLAPQLTASLRINTEQFGYVVASYTFAAGAAGLIASSIMDRFARRPAYMVLNAGFLLGTLCCAIAPSYQALLLARVATGAFGGILGGMSMTIIGDVFPENRRGQATGALMTGFALASVFGVPFGLVLGTNFGWHVPFLALVAMGLPGLLLTPFALPPLDAHIHDEHPHPLRSLVEIFSVPNHLWAFSLIATLMIGNFTVFPFVSVYFVGNLGMTEQQLPLMYILGGALSFVASPIIGRLADRHGKLRMFRIIGPIAGVFMLAITQLAGVPIWMAVLVFGLVMLCNVGRMIPAMALVTSSVEQRRRGAFLSANSSLQHIASGIGASLGGQIIVTTADEKLEHFGTVGWIALVGSLLSLWLAGRIRVVGAANAPSAEVLSRAAAAEAEAGAGEPLECAVEQFH